MAMVLRAVQHVSLNLLAALLFLLAVAPAQARSFEASVIRVIDGDSLRVRESRTHRTHELRLAGIDAPELGQPWGVQSRTALRRMVEGRQVMVEVVDRDRYGRLVARVWHGRTYVNAAMTEAGHAWAFSRYLPDKEIRQGHDTARTARRGLWSLPPEQRIPPATWRARHSNR
jgi:endonuclease YncB( thermonuclease family)